MKRTKEVTVFLYRRRVKTRNKTAKTEYCSVCGDHSELITLASAVQMAGVDPATLGEWITNQQVHATPTSQGQLGICCRSLARRMALGARSIISTTEDMLL